jgi:hypothetical protein
MASENKGLIGQISEGNSNNPLNHITDSG